MKLRALALVGLVGLLAAIVPVTGAFADEEGDDDGSEFYGVVESLPSSADLVGDWVVSGVTVHVTTETTIEQEHGPVTVGATVEVKGLAEQDGSVTATKIETKESADDDEYGTLEFYGVVESLPSSADLVGDWVVSGVTVHVTTETTIEQEHGPVTVGATVEVKGLAEQDGSVTATKIETKESADDDVKLIGSVGSFPSDGSLLGTWRVSHHRVRVVQSTRIRHAGRLHRGSDVRVVGRWTAKGTLRATRISVRS